MSNAANKLIQAAAGNAGEAVYVDDVFSTLVYDGDGTSDRALVNSMNLSETGGLIWSKRRSTSQDHYLVDTERGFANFLASNQVNPQYSSGSNGIKSFNTNGYNIGSDNAYNNNTSTYCSWTFLKQEGFFDVVVWDGDGTGAGRVISHNLGSVPGMIILKAYVHPSGVGNTDWRVYHRKLNGGTNPEQYGIYLNSTGTEDVRAWWNNTAPTSTQFTIGGGQDANGSGGKYVAYLFAHDAQDFGENSDESIIKCGSYTGNGSTTGPVIDLGFEPQFLILKNVTTGLNWLMFDTMRGLVSGGNDEYLKPNASDSAGNLDFLSVNSTGFQIDSSYNDLNKSGDTFIYVAIRRPNKPASEFAATDLFDVSAYSGAGAGTSVTTGFPVDFTWVKNRSSGYHEIWDRLRGARKYLFANSTASEGTAFSSADQWLHDYMDKFIWSGADSYASASSNTYVAWNLKRAPGFFDVSIAPLGGALNQVAHNLGVVPELVIGKVRSGGTGGWSVYQPNETNGPFGYLSTNGAFTNYAIDGSTPLTATATHITSVDSGSSSISAIYYVFASVAGISKVGTYSGTGSDVNVDCGFSAGARFVLVKRKDGTGDWYLYDSERGIVAGDDPYLVSNSDAAEVTNTDYIDPLSSGFTITSSAPAALNTSGGTYIFLAIA